MRGWICNEQRLAQLKAKIEADPSVAERLFSLETAEEVFRLVKAYMTRGMPGSFHTMKAVAANLQNVAILNKTENMIPVRVVA